jgi:hypothetical protein
LKGGEPFLKRKEAPCSLKNFLKLIV